MPEITICGAASGIGETRVPAAKIHVLGLARLKDRLGSNWECLSGLVHKLFETALARAQGASNRSILLVVWLDELTYAVVFRGLSLAEANCICSAVAREACQALFGGQIDEVSVRSLVAEIVVPHPSDTAQAGKLIEALLERDGTESVYTQSVESGSQEPVATVVEKKVQPSLPAMEQIEAAHAFLDKSGVQLGFFPVWELRHNTSSTVLLSPVSGCDERSATAVARALPDSLGDEQIATLEIELLNTAVAYARRVADCKMVCAIGVTVGYKTLSTFKSRIRYITALQKVHIKPSAPLVLQIGPIPAGTPAVRIGELAAMMKLPNIRVTLEFESLQTIPEFDFRLSAVGIGGAIRKGEDRDVFDHIARKLVQTANLQRVFAFVGNLDRRDFVDIARRNNVRFGTGVALDNRRLTGLESVPDFPLRLPQTV